MSSTKIYVILPYLWRFVYTTAQSVYSSICNFPGSMDYSLIIIYLISTYKQIHTIFIFLGLLYHIHDYGFFLVPFMPVNFMATFLSKCVILHCTTFALPILLLRDISVSNFWQLWIAHQWTWLNKCSCGRVKSPLGTCMSGVAGLWGRQTVIFWRNCHIDFHSDCTSFHSHQQ